MISDKRYFEIVKELGNYNIRLFFDFSCMEADQLSYKRKLNYVVQITLKGMLDDAIDHYRSGSKDWFARKSELVQGTLMSYFVFIKMGKIMHNPQSMMADKYKNLSFDEVVQLFKDTIDEYIEKEGLGNIVRNAWTNPKHLKI